MQLTPIDPGIQAVFSEAEQAAFGAGRLPVGSAGSLVERSNATGARFLVRVYVDAQGKHREEYLGNKADEDAVRAAIELARHQKAVVRVLREAGYQIADKKTFDTLTVMHNHGLFSAGATLVGSHAWGALLNSMGYRAEAYMTLDVDIGRDDPLEFGTEPPGGGPWSLSKMLQRTGITLVEVPELDPRKPSTSFKEQGASRFRIDLLAPSPTEEFGTVAVPELDAHATTLPFFRYLLGERVRRVVLGPRGAVPVSVPTAGRFALYKVLVSQLRANDASKAGKDLRQAAFLLEALVRRDPETIADAASAIPVSSRSRLRSGMAALERTSFLSSETLSTVCALSGLPPPPPPSLTSTPRPQPAKQRRTR
jgi:hypothetical protein